MRKRERKKRTTESFNVAGLDSDTAKRFAPFIMIQFQWREREKERGRGNFGKKERMLKSQK